MAKRAMETAILEKLKRRLSEPGGQTAIVVLVLIASFVLRFLLFRIQGCNCDLGLFTAWYQSAAENGLRSFYEATWFCDYPPFNVYIFWLFGSFADGLGADSLPTMIRLPQNLFDIGTAFLIFSFLRHRFSFKVSLAVMAIYAFNPATIFDLAVWGQVDSIYTFFMVASLYSALRSKHELSGGMLALAILTKPQSVVLLPVLAYIILRNGGWRRAVTSSAAFIAMVFLVIAPFHWSSTIGYGPVGFLIERYQGYGYYPYNSLNAYNFWALLGFWKPDTEPHAGLAYQWWGVLAFVAFLVFVMWRLHRRYDARSAIYAVFLLTFGFFMLMTRMHERYIFAAFALLALGWSTRLSPWIYLGLTGTYLANLVYVMANLNAGTFIPDGHWSLYVLAPLNIVLFVVAIWNFLRLKPSRPQLAEGPPPSELEGVEEREVRAPPVLPIPEEIEGQPPSPSPPAPTGMARWGPLLAVLFLTITFFSVATWNLGDGRAPGSDFVPTTDPQEVILDLGTTTQVDKVYLLQQDDRRIEVDFYWGSPGNWTEKADISESGSWRKWHERAIHHETRYVRLVFNGASGRVGEVALFAGDQRLHIVRSIDDKGQQAGAALIDEQDLVRNPASPKSGTYFDEIYFVRTAEEHLQLREPTQWDHPPMSKLIIAASISVFGHDPFAWRIAGVIFATLMIPLIYAFARRMFNSPRAGVIAAFLLTFDFMHFAEARIATPETYILFFVIAMFYFFYRYWQDPERRGIDLFVALVFFGFGFATKWVVMWGFLGLVLLLLVLKWRKPIHRSEVMWFAAGLATAVAIYLLSYIPYFLAGHGLADFWDMQFRMLEFHAGLEQGHPYGSEWYTWPVMLTPVYLAYGRLHEATSYIATLGNPALWWAAIPAMLLTLWLALRHCKRNAIFIIIPFLAQWLVFIPITRVLFIYHFYPNVLFMVLAVTLWAEWALVRYRWSKWVVGAFLLINVACFAFFFPLISGLPMSDGYWNSLRWLVDWVT